MNIEKDFKNKLTKKDYVTYLLQRNIILVISPAIIVLLLLAIVMAIVNSGWSFSIVLYLLPIVLFILSYFQMYRVIKNTIKSQNQIYELKVILTDNEYKDVTNGKTNVLPYDKAYCYKESKNYLYIFVDNYNALILPKREYSDEEVVKIRETFTSKMKKKSIYGFYSYFSMIVFLALVILIIYTAISM